MPRSSNCIDNAFGVLWSSVPSTSGRSMRQRNEEGGVMEAPPVDCSVAWENGCAILLARSYEAVMYAGNGNRADCLREGPA